MIRDAIELDINKILDLADAFWQHTIYTEAFERDQTQIMIEMSLACNLLIVNETDGVVDGFLAALSAPLLASTQAMQAIELAWYVDPSLRGKTVGVRLIKTMESKAKAQGIKYFNMASMQSSMPEAINSMYTKLGYDHTETTFTKIL